MAASRISGHLRSAAPSLVPAAASAPTFITHYGESYNGRTLGCSGFAAYSSEDATIVAIGPSRFAEWPCGTLLQICGPGGCQVAASKDSCPGCGPWLLDLSEAGIAQVCGAGADVCQASVQTMTLCYPPPRPSLPAPQPRPTDSLGFSQITSAGFSAELFRPDVAPSAPEPAAIPCIVAPKPQ